MVMTIFLREIKRMSYNVEHGNSIDTYNFDDISRKHLNDRKFMI